MTKTTKGHAQTDTTQNHDRRKDSQNQKTISRVLSLLATGGKFTAREINSTCGTNNARKYISDFGIKYGITINREWTDNGNKLFWIGSERKEVVL